MKISVNFKIKTLTRPLRLADISAGFTEFFCFEQKNSTKPAETRVNLGGLA